MSKLVQIKLFHTFFWLIEAVAIFYLFITGIIGEMNTLVIISFSIVILEGLILLYFKWRCPLTILAENYSDDKTIGFDIYLPRWLAKHNKTIFSIIFGLAVVLHISQYLFN